MVHFLLLPVLEVWRIQIRNFFSLTLSLSVSLNEIYKYYDDANRVSSITFWHILSSFPIWISIHDKKYVGFIVNPFSIYKLNTI